ncbi:MAG: thiamine-phosphate kinase [bacterium]|nr:thiamine-phosphate kinase [bacterium]
MAGERELTARLARFFAGSTRLPVGIGDDAAVVPNRKEHSVVCCDPVVEGVHFETGTAWPLVGRKAVNRNLADLAAMGAIPDWLLVSVVQRAGTGAAAVLALLRGVRAAARNAGCEVVGGDLATADGPTVVTVTAIGHLVGRRPLTRAGARAGDTLHVTGPLGGSRAGHHLRFTPPLAAGAWLARQVGTHAAIDVSDGLLLDLATMLAASATGARASRLGAELSAAALPIRAVARAGAAATGALKAALTDGEDHVLLFAHDGELARGGPLSQRARRPIGRVTNGPGIVLVHPDGRRERRDPAGFEHVFSERR